MLMRWMRYAPRPNLNNHQDRNANNCFLEKMREKNRTNGVITNAVIVADFVIMDFVLFVIYNFAPSQLPHYCNDNFTSFVIMLNLSMVVSEYFFSTIILRRFANFEIFAKRVLKLVLTHLAILFLFFVILGKSARGNIVHFLAFYGSIMFVILLVSRMLERLFFRYVREVGHNCRCAVFIGNDPALNIIYNSMLDDMSMEYVVKGYFSNSDMQDCPKGLRRLSSLDSFARMISDDIKGKADAEDDKIKALLCDTDELFCSLSHDENETIEDIMHYCDHHFIHFLYVPRTLGNMQLKLKPTYFGQYMIYTNHPEPLQRTANRFVKRLFDMVFSSIVCLCLLPFIPIIALIIKCQSRGPIFFGQDRTGYNGKAFKCWKFRSMHVSADADTKQATKDDPRKFAFGNFMRKSNIDELPQFFNVLKGDMSVVGPRPHMLHHTDIYGNLIEKYMVRHLCKPGITGWAQVTGFRGETKELWQMEERVKRDIWYIENWSFWLDIKIVFLTVFNTFFNHKGAY